MMRPTKQNQRKSPFLLLAIAGLSLTGVQLAVIGTQDANKTDKSETIANCASASIASASIVPVQSQKAADEKFVMDAAEAGMTEVALGNLAMDRATSPEVKDYAKMMVDDHTKANEELRAVAQKKGITLPAQCKDCSKKVMDLEKLKGQDFDKKYSEMMVKSHKEVISKFEKESASGNDQDVKSWATAKLPALKHHLSVAEGLKH